MWITHLYKKDFYLSQKEMPPSKRRDSMCKKVRACGPKLLTFVHSGRPKNNCLPSSEAFRHCPLGFHSGVNIFAVDKFSWLATLGPSMQLKSCLSLYLCVLSMSSSKTCFRISIQLRLIGYRRLSFYIIMSGFWRQVVGFSIQVICIALFMIQSLQSSFTGN